MARCVHLLGSVSTASSLQNKNRLSYNKEMNYKRIFGTALTLLTALSMQAGTYTFKIGHPMEGAKLKMTWCTSGEHADVEVVNGMATIQKSDFTPQYVTVTYGRAFRHDLYLESNKDLTVDYDTETRVFNCTGALASINNYLLKTRFAFIGFDAAGKDEAAYIKSNDSVYDANLALLKKANLPSGFAKKEQERLKFQSYSQFPMYKSYHPYILKQESYTPTSLYLNKLKELAVVDGRLFQYSGYGDFIMNSILCQAFNGGDRKKEFMEFMDANVKDAKVKEYVTNAYLYGVVSGSGLDGNDEVIAYFHKNVTDAQKVEKFNKMCQQWESLKAGNPSPSFNCPDINGKMVSLESLKGKYVYIDVWATWCGPCRGELPYMTKLEEAYADKDIYFVGLSCDQNKSAWEKRIQKGDMKGIQLHMGNKDEFMTKYIINGIPRFILLDREGKIIKADAPRPSNPETSKLFDELLKK